MSPVLAVVTALLFNWIASQIGVRAGGVADTLHTLSAGAVNFARGLNDAPKIAAMLSGVQSGLGAWGFVVVALAMAAGELLHSRKIADTISLWITVLDHREELAANLATATLVCWHHSGVFRSLQSICRLALCLESG